MGYLHPLPSGQNKSLIYNGVKVFIFISTLPDKNEVYSLSRPLRHFRNTGKEGGGDGRVSVQWRMCGPTAPPEETEDCIGL